VTWIQRLSNLDPRIVETLRLRRTNKWTYGIGSSSNPSILGETYKDLGYPPSWGDPSVVPEYGGKLATEEWKNLGVKGREGVGGVPCEGLHYLPSIFGNTGENIVATELKRSCTANALLRMGRGFVDSTAIYLPVRYPSVSILYFPPYLAYPGTPPSCPPHEPPNRLTPPPSCQNPPCLPPEFDLPLDLHRSLLVLRLLHAYPCSCQASPFCFT